MKIRRAEIQEATTLSGIAQAAKAHWGYTADDLASWRDELTITGDSLRQGTTFVAEVDRKAVGFCQVSFVSHKAELEHLWVLPTHMGLGVGRALLNSAIAAAVGQGYDQLWIDSDPNAADFYTACGAQHVGEKSAPVRDNPNRKRPQFCLAKSPTRCLLNFSI